MKKIYLMMILVLSAFTFVGCDLFGAATTTEVETVTVDTENFIEVATASELATIELDKSYILTADIDISDLEWTPIGTYLEPYLGIFDGDGHTISGLTITETDADAIGLFGFMRGEVWNLNLTNISIDITTSFLTYVGGIAGFTFGNIIDSSVTGDIHVKNYASNTYVGLLTGYAQAQIVETTTIDDFEPGLLQGNEVSGTLNIEAGEIAYIGGLAGKTYNTSANNNTAIVTIDVISDGTDLPVYIGGFIGHNYGGILYNYQSEVDDINIYIEDNISCSVINVTNTAANVYAGGFLGFNQKGYVRDNFSQSAITMDGAATEANTIRIGGFLGENFESQVDATVVSITIDTTDFTGDIEKSVFVAGRFTELPAEDIYITGMTVILPESEDDITLFQLTSLDDTDFYVDNLGWTLEFANLIIASIS